MTIQKLMQLDIEFCEAVSKAGAEAWGKHFMQDGIMVTKSGDNIIGEPAVYSAMKPFFQQKGSSLTWSPENGGISDAGDLGYTYGKYIRQVRNEDGEKVISTGRYLTIWRKQANNTYQIELDMGN